MENESSRNDPETNEAERLDRPWSVDASTRRVFIKQVAGTSAGVVLASHGIQAHAAEPPGGESNAGLPKLVDVQLKINGKDVSLSLDPRVTLLDALRNHLMLTGYEEGMRSRAVRRMHGPGERAQDQFVPHVGRHARGRLRSPQSRASRTATRCIPCRRLSSSTMAFNAGIALPARSVPLSRF